MLCHWMPQKKWDMGSMDFAETGWWGWHILAIAAIFLLGYSMRRGRNEFND